MKKKKAKFEETRALYKKLTKYNSNNKKNNSARTKKQNPSGFFNHSLHLGR